MIYAILSILVFTLLVWAINKKLPIQICPICAGVTLTWLWMLLGMWLGFLSVARYEILTAILMGASIGGMVTELKKIFSKFRNRNETKSKKVESLESKLKNCC
jgi:hypothetical protein